MSAEDFSCNRVSEWSRCQSQVAFLEVYMRLITNVLNEKSRSLLLMLISPLFHKSSFICLVISPFHAFTLQSLGFLKNPSESEQSPTLQLLRATDNKHLKMPLHIFLQLLTLLTAWCIATKWIIIAHKH